MGATFSFQNNQTPIQQKSSKHFELNVIQIGFTYNNIQVFLMHDMLFKFLKVNEFLNPQILMVCEPFTEEKSLYICIINSIKKKQSRYYQNVFILFRFLSYNVLFPQVNLRYCY
ncbi:hypothetical protein TTHERM_000476562 (macronuclear) [Tetrahymena thermophila SB210]|uniref:Uncharacterized protein n=1 Tax=Tetrahymena thermophila (strain SB210) TaxID=312017 RepID=W7XHU4_TETTS|nr:hypothetical protein TTHERM_000476562 [Tetrahymena thermophila SB210]EWS74051.1 hypothetical protein TTHERM_000476562 [Tetrahymena thermophila SB210]|eukprot:XP_012653384.1 hypothetical protein TTHERM_000476562 [Tetrahymena thermophila SB210]